MIIPEHSGSIRYIAQNEIRSKSGTGNQVDSFFTCMVDNSSVIAFDSNNRLWFSKIDYLAMWFNERILVKRFQVKLSQMTGVQPLVYSWLNDLLNGCIWGTIFRMSTNDAIQRNWIIVDKVASDGQPFITDDRLWRICWSSLSSNL